MCVLYSFCLVPRPMSPFSCGVRKTRKAALAEDGNAMSDPTCVDCAFWLRLPDTVEYQIVESDFGDGWERVEVGQTTSTTGQCRRLPPRSTFPVTPADCWCGEFTVRDDTVTGDAELVESAAT